jgi:hypothetical protein
MLCGACGTGFALKKVARCTYGKNIRIARRVEEVAQILEAQGSNNGRSSQLKKL